MKCDRPYFGIVPFTLRIIFLLLASYTTSSGQNCSPTVVVLQPFDYKVCQTGDAFFYIKANDATRYQWQINSGSGWFDLFENNTYVGVTKDSLFIKNVTPAMASNLFRCEVYNGCSNTVSFPGALTIGNPERPTVKIEQLNTTLCTGVPVSYVAKVFKSGTAPVFDWLVNNISSGAHTNTFVSNNLKEGDIIQCNMVSNASCITTANVSSPTETVHFLPTVLPTVQILQADTIICQGSTAPSTFTVLVYNGGVDPDFEWRINSTTIGTNSNILSTVGLRSGDTVRVIMKSKDPCANPMVVVSKDMILDISPTINSSIGISTDDTIICKGSRVTFSSSIINGGAHPIYNWMINNKLQDKFDSVFSTTSLQDGDVVSCLLTSKIPCFRPVFSNGITIHVKDGPVVKFPTDTLIVVGNSVNLKPEVTGSVVGYDWEPAFYLDDNHISDPVSTPLHTVTYSLSVTSPTGCVVSGKTTIKVIDHIIVSNIFTPNNDGINDRWEIIGLSTYLDCKVQVFNRYGQVVFSSVGYNTPWDGTYKGKVLPGGTYYYVIETKTDKKLFSGFVGIIR